MRIGAKSPLRPHAVRHTHGHDLRLGALPGPDRDYLTGHQTKGTLTDRHGVRAGDPGRAGDGADEDPRRAWERAQRGRGGSHDKLRVFEVPPWD